MVRRNCDFSCSGTRRSKRALIIGVSDSDTAAEIRIETASVIANSRNSRPTTSVMNSSGINTAISETVSEMIVNPIWPAPFSAASIGESPASTKRAMFSIITIASSTTNPVATVNAINVRLLMLKPARYMTPKVPTIDSGTATAGITVADALRKKMKIASTTSTMASSNSS